MAKIVALLMFAVLLLLSYGPLPASFALGFLKLMAVLVFAQSFFFVVRDFLEDQFDEILS